jgi:GTP-binding protein
VERCRLLIHVLDLQPLDGSDPLENHATVEQELRGHGHGLAGLPRILCLSKADLVPPARVEEAEAEWTERLGGRVLGVLSTSAATGAGLERLEAAIFQRVPAEPAREEPPRPEEPAVHRVYRPGAADAVRVERLGPGSFRVQGERVARLIARHDMDNDDAQRYVEERLRALGVIRALESAGFEPGDDVEIAGLVFELDPGARFR